MEQTLKDLECIDVRTVTAHEMERERGGRTRMYPLFLLLGRSTGRPAAR